MFTGHLRVEHQIDKAFAMFAPWKHAWKHCSSIIWWGRHEYSETWKSQRKSIASSPFNLGGMRRPMRFSASASSLTFFAILLSDNFCTRHALTATMYFRTFCSISSSFLWNLSMLSANSLIHVGIRARLAVAPISAMLLPAICHNSFCVSASQVLRWLFTLCRLIFFFFQFCEMIKSEFGALNDQSSTFEVSIR